MADALLDQWPPRTLSLSRRVFPERAERAESPLDLWAARALTVWRGRLVRRLSADDPVLRAALALGAACSELDDAGLRAGARDSAAAAFIRRDAAAAPRALAIVREAARRTIGLCAHPPQLLAAWRLLCGRLVELDTGEGKTLAAALAGCIAALARVPTHVVTVNDYLAQRDADAMRPLFRFFGLDAGVVHGGVEQHARRSQYACDLTYCTNKDLVFDYLRDRVGSRGLTSLAGLSIRELHGLGKGAEPLRLRGLHFAIVDEADSILVDEARTPLILSSARAGDGDDAHYRSLLEVAAALEGGVDYRLHGALQLPELTAAGCARLEDHAARVGDASGAEFWRVPWVREQFAAQALRALYVLRRDHHYVVQDGKVVIVDEFTGRLFPDRSWEQGLHQLVEAKEGCAVTGVNRTMARLTFQTFFARYLRLAGMSGTLKEVARETAAVYRVRTERVEPNLPMRRFEWPTLLLPDLDAKHQAVVEEVRRCLARGQPVLVGTRSVQSSQALSEALRAAGIRHRVLNALQTALEAELIAHAGSSGAVTVATNMAGRGTDIPLERAVVACGGLHVVLTEWHESPRIDRQLFGRCARQGDPGSCRAIVSLEDEVIRRYSPRLARWIATRWPDGAAPPRALRALQRRVQAMAERVNGIQRRTNLRHDRRMQAQLAFSGIAE